MLKLISLNIEGDKHLDQVIPFIIKQNPDVACLQEVLQNDLIKLEHETKMFGTFYPMVNITKQVPFVNAGRGLWGGCNII